MSVWYEAFSTLVFSFTSYAFACSAFQRASALKLQKISVLKLFSVRSDRAFIRLRFYCRMVLYRKVLSGILKQKLSFTYSAIKHVWLCQLNSKVETQLCSWKFQNIFEKSVKEERGKVSAGKISFHIKSSKIEINGKEGNYECKRL